MVDPGRRSVALAMAVSGVLSTSAPARGDDQAAPASDEIEARLYSTAGVGVAVLNTRTTYRRGNQETETDTQAVARWSFGVALGRRDGFSGSVGPVADLYSSRLLTFGVEARLEQRIDSCWHIALRLAVGRKTDYINDETGYAVTGGVHLRTGHRTLGLEAIRLTNDGREDSYHGSSIGLIASGGLEGRPASIAIGVSAGLTLLGGGLFVLALLSGNPSGYHSR